MPVSLLSFVILERLPIVVPYSLTNKSKGCVLLVDVALTIFIFTNTPTQPLTIIFLLLFSHGNFNKRTSVNDYSKIKHFCNNESIWFLLKVST